eukprot:NODE_88_length_21789_cov_0.534440.p12 type:complete len:226 gc:universal NODE_88_length_21789_cov_0.534440:2014-1337(-)
MSSNQYEFLLKAIIIGSSNVGKSTILKEFVKRQDNEDLASLSPTNIENYNPTIGVEFASTVFKIEPNRFIKLQIWDTAGQERFQSITQSYYRSSAIACVVYSVDNPNTFYQMEDWIRKIRLYSPNCVLLIVGNKVDKRTQESITTEQGHELAKRYEAIFCETSIYHFEKEFKSGLTRAIERILAKIENGELDIESMEKSGIVYGNAKLYSSNHVNLTNPNNKFCC